VFDPLPRGLGVAEQGVRGPRCTWCGRIGLSWCLTSLPEALLDVTVTWTCAVPLHLDGGQNLSIGVIVIPEGCAMTPLLARLPLGSGLIRGEISEFPAIAEKILRFLDFRGVVSCLFWFASVSYEVQNKNDTLKCFYISKNGILYLISEGSFFYRVMELKILTYNFQYLYE